MKIVIINGSARKGNILTAINAFMKGAADRNAIEEFSQTNCISVHVKAVVSVNVIKAV